MLETNPKAFWSGPTDSDPQILHLFVCTSTTRLVLLSKNSSIGVIRRRSAQQAIRRLPQKIRVEKCGHVIPYSSYGFVRSHGASPNCSLRHYIGWRQMLGATKVHGKPRTEQIVPQPGAIAISPYRPARFRVSPKRKN